jgi:putative ABC transport system permease protein
MPDWKHEIRRRLSRLKLAPVREAEIVEELAQHAEDRYQELLVGIRVALGAQRWTVVNLIIRQGMSLALLGAVIGLIAAFALTRLLEGLLYGVEATDPLTFASITILLLLISLAACWIPARRAAKVDPLVALRDH